MGFVTTGSMGTPGQFDNSLFRETLAEITLKAIEHDIEMEIHEGFPAAQNNNSLIKDSYRVKS